MTPMVKAIDISGLELGCEIFARKVETESPMTEMA
jgi:hypothetical protein